jgi:transposase
MYETELITKALNLVNPWSVTKTELDLKKNEFHIYISYCDNEQLKRIPNSKGEFGKLHDHKTKTWRHISFFQYVTYIHCDIPRIKYDDGEIKQIDVPWARKNSGFTLLFEIIVIELAKQMTIADCSRYINEPAMNLWRIILLRAEEGIDTYVAVLMRYMFKNENITEI